MPPVKRSLVGRGLVQVDRAFWCIHEHLDVLALLGLPTLVGMAGGAAGMVFIWRTWALPGWVNFLLIAVVLPWLGILLFTALPLPAAVFAWRLGSGEQASPGACYAWCARRSARLLWAIFRMALLWLVSLAFLGVPLLVVWPRTSLVPLVALFEDTPRVFHRSRRMLREDLAIYVLGGIFFCMAIVLGGLVATPRILLGTSALGANLLEARWRRLLLDNLWIFESLSTAVVLTALALSWWIALTLLYQEVRWTREGEDLLQKIRLLRTKVLNEGLA